MPWQSHEHVSEDVILNCTVRYGLATYVDVPPFVVQQVAKVVVRPGMPLLRRLLARNGSSAMSGLTRRAVQSTAVSVLLAWRGY